MINKQRAENARFRREMERRDEEHRQQMKNMEDANEKKLRDQKKENYESNQKLNREILNWKEKNESKLKEIQRLEEKVNEAPGKGKAEFESTNKPRHRQASFESTNTPFKTPATTPSKMHASSDGGKSVSAAEGERIKWRTVVATSRVTETAAIKSAINFVQPIVPPIVPPIVHGPPVADVLGAAAQVSKECSIM